MTIIEEYLVYFHKEMKKNGKIQKIEKKKGCLNGKQMS